MPEQIPFFRVFLSSPGDVNDERQAVLEALKRLPNRPAFREKVGFRVVAWDQPGADTPMLATMSPQAAIDAGLPRPSECDIVVCILWSRMGTPFTMDGVGYQSGTHYELLDALNTNRPETLIYRRTEKKLFAAEDTDGQTQYQRVQDFFAGELFFDPTTKHPQRGVNHYSSPADFRDKIETHIEEIIVRLLKRLETRPAQPRIESPPLPPSVVTIATKRWEGSPFPGLRSFTKDDAPIFFGRERETDALVKRITDHHFVAVVGASGSGKSSLVGAGVLSRLAANAISDETTGSKDWFVVQFTPGGGDHPFAALKDGLFKTFEAMRPLPQDRRRAKTQFIQDMLADPLTLSDLIAGALEQANAPAWAEVLLFIDQFEELFTVAKPETIPPFAQMLATLADHPRVRVIVTLRHDFVHRAIEVPELADLLNLSSFHLSAPARGVLAQMIKRPAELAALEFEEGLPEQILSDMGGDAGALALMAYTLDELYVIADQRHDRRLTFADYERLGGVQGAVGKRAEQTFQSMKLDDKEALLGRVFRELVEVDERGTATRQRAPQGRFGDPELALVRAFTDARLLVMGELEVEVAHEALFRSWDRLKNWIAEAQEDLILLRQVRNAAHDWQTKGRPTYLLWQQERLMLVYAMQERLTPELNEVEHDFIEPEQQRLLRELHALPATAQSHERRRDIGDRLAVIGDTRPGVGVKNGLPDVLWLPVEVSPNPVVIKTDEIEIGPLTIAPFFIAPYQITYTQFQAFLDASDGFDDDRWWVDLTEEYKKQPIGNQRTKIANAPRDSVSWYQSVAFARWINYQWRGLELSHPSGVLLRVGENAEIRLPVEWEWQWAAQGGAEARDYPWGDWREDYANTDNAGLNRTTAVGMYPHGAAPCGALDMAGNLFNWCQNDHDNHLAVLGYSNERIKVLRGGSFNFSRGSAALSYRYDDVPYDRYDNYGLRLVVGVPIASLSSDQSDL